MPNTLDPFIALPLALVALLIAGALWYFLVRPVPEKTGTGVIIGRTFETAQTVKKSIPSTTRSLEHYSREIEYTLPDRYVYAIRIDGSEGTDARFSVPAAGGQEIEIGRQVRLVYVERYLPFVGKRIYVKEMTACS